MLGIMKIIISIETIIIKVTKITEIIIVIRMKILIIEIGIHT